MTKEHWTDKGIWKQTTSHPVLTELHRKIESLEVDNATLRSERDRLFTDHERDVENIRLILIDSLATDQRDYVDVDILANSIADVLGIELTKDINVVISLNVTASMTVPFNFNLEDLDIHDVAMDAFNTDVDNFSVDTWDVFGVEES